MRLELEQLLKGDVSFDYHSKVRPNACEASAVKSALELISRLEVRAHFCHLSTLEAVGMIRKEKYLAKRENKSLCLHARSLPITCFSLQETGKGSGFGKMNPPLRSSHSIKALVNGLNDGTIDMVASDHAPHLESEKDADIRAAPSGVPGVETLMPLMLAAVRKNILPLSQMIMVTSRNPAKAFGLDRLGKGRLEVGFDADLMIVDPRNLQHKADMLHSKAGWTPFEGMDAVFPEYTLSRGEVIWMEESINARPGRGKFLEGSGKRSKEDEEEDYEETGSE
ncbi:amidohydrolase family protein [Methanosarcina horonobensis]|uniref:amidohydrolase family protein n=1 Tax=Methanosarcina horonobensis TaxID=418008 RepID=UPI000A732CD5|nr:amidohydrolase family protein [Methanosarcina horonobensis]